MTLSKAARAAVICLIMLIGASPLSAEVTRATDTGFVSRHEVIVKASSKNVWLALISPANWWQSAHTWSGDAKNLMLTPQAGGCFCETIPEVSEPGRFTLEGSVEHMRVVQAYPESALRMVGSLGPLQSEPVIGVLTIAISTTPKGTRIVWEYNVGGTMRYEIPVISKAVDGMMGAQLSALVKPLGVVEVPAPSAPAPSAAVAPETSSASPATAPAASPKPAAIAPGGAIKPVAPPVIRPVPTLTAPQAPVAKPSSPPAGSPTPAPAAKPAPKSPTVADAFGDLDDPR